MADNPLTTTPSVLSDPTYSPFSARFGPFQTPGSAAEEEAAGAHKQEAEEYRKTVQTTREANKRYEEETAGPRAAIKQTLDTPRPRYPGQETPPPPPNPQDYHKMSTEWLGAMAVLGAFGGALVRKAGNAPIKSFAAAINGWQEGNLQRYREAQEQWKEQSARVLEINRQRLDQYRAILEDRSLTLEEQASRMRLAAMERQDRIMYDKSVAQDYGAMGQAYDMSAGAQTKAEATRQKLFDESTKVDDMVKERANQWRDYLQTPEGLQWINSEATPAAQKMQVQALINQYADKVSEAPKFVPDEERTAPATVGAGAMTPATTPQPTVQQPTQPDGWKSPLPPPRRPAPGSAQGWTWDKIDFEAGKLLRQGPQGIRALAGMPAPVREAVTQRADEMAAAGGKSPGQVVAEQAGVKGSIAALGTLKKQEAAVDSYGQNMLKNGDQLLALAKKVNQTGVPVLQRWVNAGKVAVRGDPDVAEFDLQLRLWIPELARTAVNPNLTGVLTEGARKEFESVIPSGATVPQFTRLIARAHQDFNNRRDTIRQQISMVEGDISGERGREEPTSDDDGWTITETGNK